MQNFKHGLQRFNQGPWHKDNRINLYKKAELSENDHYELYEFCKKNKIIFLTSVFNKKYLDFFKTS